MAVAGLLVLGSCSAGKDAVDQGAGGQFRFTGATRHGQAIPLEERKRAGAVVGELISGAGSFTLAQYSGRVVVLNFWASYCGPCQIESPNFEHVYTQMQRSGVQFVGIDIKEVTRSKGLSFLRDFGITYPNVWDPKAKTALQLGKLPVAAAGLPWTAVVDSKQRVAAVYIGPVLPRDLEPVLTSLLAER